MKVKENKIRFCSYWNKKRLMASVNELDLLPEKKERIGERKNNNDPKCDTLKTIMKNPRKVTLTDIETAEIKTFPSIYKASKFIGRSPMVYFWDGKIWNNK